jgi:hypothetical protein
VTRPFRLIQKVPGNRWGNHISYLQARNVVRFLLKLNGTFEL